LKKAARTLVTKRGRSKKKKSCLAGVEAARGEEKNENCTHTTNGPAPSTAPPRVRKRDKHPLQIAPFSAARKEERGERNKRSKKKKASEKGSRPERPRWRAKKKAPVELIFSNS